jgi:hypothetical protein
VAQHAEHEELQVGQDWQRRLRHNAVLSTIGLDAIACEMVRSPGTG